MNKIRLNFAQLFWISDNHRKFKQKDIFPTFFHFQSLKLNQMSLLSETFLLNLPKITKK